jgi:hypothetical protein
LWGDWYDSGVVPRDKQPDAEDSRNCEADQEEA